MGSNLGLGLVLPSAFPSRPGMPHRAPVSAAQSWPPRLRNPVPTLWRLPAHLARLDTDLAVSSSPGTCVNMLSCSCLLLPRRLEGAVASHM